MTTPTVPVVNSMAGLRKLWPEWDFCKVSLGSTPVELIAERLKGECRIFSAMQWSEAEAAQALAEQLVTAGYPPKEE